MLTHWVRVTHICVSELAIIFSDNGLSPGRRQAIIRSNAGILLIEPLRTNFGEISVVIHTFSFKEMHLKMSSGKWRPFCLGLNVLTTQYPEPRLDKSLWNRNHCDIITHIQVHWYEFVNVVDYSRSKQWSFLWIKCIIGWSNISIVQ